MMIYLRVIGDFVVQRPKDASNLDLFLEWWQQHLQALYIGRFN